MKNYIKPEAEVYKVGIVSPLCESGTPKEPGQIDEGDAKVHDYFRRTRQTLWSAVQMLTQKLCCQTIHDCPKVVPLHYESE